MDTLAAGQGGLSKIDLRSADGAQAEIYFHGAHVTSWIPAGGDERLFLSPRAEFAPDKAIRGGVPVIFPQFDREGSLPRHGFARTANWTLVESGEGTATLRLTDSDATHAIWSVSFIADLTVAVAGDRLSLSFAVSNTGDAPLLFTCALHTYVRVQDIADVYVEGLQGVRYSDKVMGGAWEVERDDALRITGEVDRVYLDAPQPVVVTEPGRRTEISQTGFSDVVVWNPWHKAASLPDMAPDGYRHMLCVEAARIGQPVRLDAGASWRGTQKLRAV